MAQTIFRDITVTWVNDIHVSSHGRYLSSFSSEARIDGYRMGYHGLTQRSQGVPSIQSLPTTIGSTWLISTAIRSSRNIHLTIPKLLNLWILSVSCDTTVQIVHLCSLHGRNLRNFLTATSTVKQPRASMNSSLWSRTHCGNSRKLRMSGQMKTTEVTKVILIVVTCIEDSSVLI